MREESQKKKKKKRVRENTKQKKRKWDSKGLKYVDTMADDCPGGVL